MRRLKGHSSSILCCAAASGDGSAAGLVSGGEDGRVCVFDLRGSNEASQKYSFFDGLPVPSVCYNPVDMNLVYAAAGSSIYCFDLRLVRRMFLHVIAKHTINADDINQLAVNRKATFLAASDDSGETKILDLKNNRTFKTLRGHTNICSAVQFHPLRPWELVTGGLDSKMIKWDFNRGKQLAALDLGCVSDASKQIFNPPFVHALACPQREISGELGRTVAVARGDGGTDVYDLNGPAKRDPSQGLARKCSLDVDQGGHTAPVSHVNFASFDESGRTVISGGNDSSIKIWDWTACELKLSLNHNRKVNWMTTRASSSDNLIVADTSKFLRVYSVPV
ncbi:hypothetical protein SELMODRAFT_184954 [Selaginella moellendorffii]|uniref:Anaphase-promoting complex subunit 4 WD40 domain-containing protein n=1 Tax=Selaginella moellendorffii TaxID=88036 RepID=D8T322_SELML|nr:hypothetical protein SELMODRAFT_184954 [Selaginella moellendorffii]